MADEIRFSTSLQVTNGPLNVKHSANTTADQTTAGAWLGVQEIGTSEEVVSLAGVTAARAIHVKNIDDTNYVDLGPELTGAMVALIRLKAGESAVLPLKPGIVLRAQANTAAVDISYMLVET